MVAENRARLSGKVCSPVQTRQSPAGIPISRFTLEHESTRKQAGSTRKVRCRIRVILSGAELQAVIAILDKDTEVVVEGFISYESSRSEESRLVLHAESIEKLN